MERDRPGDPESILTSEDAQELQATLILRHPVVPQSSVEMTLAHYADSLERLVGTDPAMPANQYTLGFVAGIRAAAKVAANANGM
jgi:hypothetical protein